MSSSQRLNGQSFDFDVGGMAIHAQKFSLKISDNTTAAKKDGRPDGWLQGDVAADGDMELDRVEYKKIIAAAKAAGSFQQMEPFDIVAYAKLADDEVKVEAFGCKLKMDSILDADKNSTDASVFKIAYNVTSPDFIKIDGVPYIKPITGTGK